MAQVFSCEFCEISKNTFFTEHLSTAVSESKSNTGLSPFAVKLSIIPPQPPAPPKKNPRNYKFFGMNGETQIPQFISFYIFLKIKENEFINLNSKL